MGERKQKKGASSLRDSAELPAGRELDALVAVLVMGWRKHRVAPYPPSKSQADKVWRPPHSDHAYCLPRFSTDIAAAWQVVERMRDHSDPSLRNLHLVAWCYNRTYATFGARDDDAGYAEGNGEHATPLAICHAALRAVGTSGEVPADSAISAVPPGSPRTET